MRKDMGREPWPVKRIGLNKAEARECWVTKNCHTDPKITWGVYYDVHFMQAGTEYKEGCFDTEAEAVAYMEGCFGLVSA